MILYNFYKDKIIAGQTDLHPCLKCGCPPEIMKLYGGYLKHACGPCSETFNDHSIETQQALLSNKFATKCGKSAWHIHDDLHLNSLKNIW